MIDVHTAKLAGNVTRYIDNNIKCRKGIKVLDIFGANSTSNELSPSTGVLSYYYDGFEKVFTPETLADIDTLLPVDEKGARLAITVSDIRKDKVEKEDVIYKVITSDTWYTVVFIPLEEAENFNIGSKVSLEFESGTVAATIKDVVTKEKQALVIVSTSKYLEKFDQLRECEVELVTQDEKGLIIPNTALATEEGKTGVYVKRIDGSFVFVQVKVKASNENESVVYADQYSELREDGLTDTIYTISLYDEILKDASEKTE